MPKQEKWFARLDDGLYGPLSRAEVRELAAQGCVRRDTLVSSDCVHWQPAGEAFGSGSSARRSPDRSAALSVVSSDPPANLGGSSRGRAAIATVVVAIALLAPVPFGHVPDVLIALVVMVAVAYRWMWEGEVPAFVTTENLYGALVVVSLIVCGVIVCFLYDMVRNSRKRHTQTQSMPESSEPLVSRRRGPVA